MEKTRDFVSSESQLNAWPTATPNSMRNKSASLVSQSMDKEAIMKMYASQSIATHLSCAIEELQAGKTQSSSVIESVTQNNSLSPEMGMTSQLYDHLFNLMSGVMEQNASLMKTQQSLEQRMQDAIQTQESIANQYLANGTSLATRQPMKQNVTSLDPSVNAEPDHSGSTNNQEQSGTFQKVVNGPDAPIAHHSLDDVQIEGQQTVRRTIILNMPSGEKQRHVQSHTFKRVGYKDFQTGAVRWDKWTEKQAIIPAYVVENITGYTRQPKAIPSMIVRPDSQDSVVQVIYRLKPVVKPVQQPMTKDQQTAPAVKQQPITVSAQELQQVINEDEQQGKLKVANGVTRQQLRITGFSVFAAAFATLLGCMGNASAS
ncbi:mucin-binding protein [uncultured Limosilactobacillus sp.]|uniref:mucin-binding protein n=1 Tax=uncultured Limosilactobacillus sp. TaxID=2837629 RepID=UPI0025E38956|nr:hypothetical protein [uncultured Limosilactobacillus sp.]